MKQACPGTLRKKRMRYAYGIMCLAFIVYLSLFCGSSFAEEPAPNAYTLDSIIRYALRNNPRIRMSGKDIEAEVYGLDAAKAERMPKLDLGSGAFRYRYPTPLTPIYGPLGPDADLPDFERNVYDTGLSFRLPLFKGGRLYRGVRIAEMKKAVAEDTYTVNKQELVYNLSSVYYKIAQLEKLLTANEASVRQLETHKKNVELFLKAGTVPSLDLLKAEVELSHARENRLLVKNSLDSAYELLKTLMGIDDMERTISIAHGTPSPDILPAVEDSIGKAFAQRPDYKAVEKKKIIGEERIKVAQGKRFPDIYATGEYTGRAGDRLAFKENWNVGVRLIVPVFDGGLIRSEIDKERNELEKVREEERMLRLTIIREIRDAHLNIANAKERIEVTEKAIASAQENLRVELLKYDTGAGTSTDVIDARTALLRAETEYYQAIYDKEAAFAYLRKAVGEDNY
ncbi:MAG: Outer membrane protein TolC precursor [Syntrophorhabdus sp. PtaU1.Bin058]|nr:MAG: Outer membrane protein TolC precursor [Syntrophorhabdus sp. PtaU1.Bin058]